MNHHEHTLPVEGENDELPSLAELTEFSYEFGGPSTEGYIYTGDNYTFIIRN